MNLKEFVTTKLEESGTTFGEISEGTFEQLLPQELRNTLGERHDLTAMLNLHGVRVTNLEKTMLSDVLGFDFRNKPEWVATYPTWNSDGNMYSAIFENNIKE